MNTNEEYCFVIQPLSNETFTKRFDDTYKPAIESCNLRAYRVDLDPSVKNIIDEIENKIRFSTLCFADISLDNPNVWYELGYASALGKDVIIVCDENRKDFPFDIRQRSIITYKSTSLSDFNSLKDRIIVKMNSFISSQHKTNFFLSNQNQETNSLQPFEIALLAYIMGEQITDQISVSVYAIKNMMNKSGYNDVTISIGIRLLINKGFLKTSMDSDWNGNEFEACKLTEKGITFILGNPTLFNLGGDKIRNMKSDDDEKIPF